MRPAKMHEMAAQQAPCFTREHGLAVEAQGLHQRRPRGLERDHGQRQQ
ncbi:hypothetical protein [Cupriavidus basilensis]|nr:hypothetical protein [Cupriavidus basilensis]